MVLSHAAVLDVNGVVETYAKILGSGALVHGSAMIQNRSPVDRMLLCFSLFRFLSEEQFTEIKPLLQEEHYEFGDVIVRQDDPADSFYVLTQGRARALKIKSDGEEIPLEDPKTGRLIGEVALTEGGTRSATVR